MSTRKCSRTHVDAIQRMLHLGNVSMTGLAEILRALRSEEPERISAAMYEMRHAQDLLFSELRLGIELQLSGGGEPFVGNWRTH